MRSMYLGLDLTSSPVKPTAAAVLDGALAVVDLGFCRSDDDMVALVEPRLWKTWRGLTKPRLTFPAPDVII